MFPIHLWKIGKRKPKHVDTVVDSIQTLPFPVEKSLSNPHNNPRPPVDFYRTNLSTFSRADKYVVSDEISHSYDRTTSHPKYSVIFKGTKLYIGINFYPEDLKAP